MIVVGEGTARAPCGPARVPGVEGALAACLALLTGLALAAPLAAQEAAAPAVEEVVVEEVVTQEEAAPSAVAPDGFDPDFAAGEVRLPSPVDPTEFGEALTLLDAAEPDWVLDDGVGEGEVPWDAFDPVTDYLPRARFTTGFSLRIAALPFGDEPTLDGPLLELGYFVDYRVGASSLWHLRAVLTVAYQPHYEGFVGGGVTRSTSPFAAKLRLVPVAIDLGNLMVARVGGDVGMQWISRPDSDAGALEWAGGASAELCLRLFESRLEVGAVAGFQLTAIGELSRPNRYRTFVTPEAVFGATVQGLLP